MSWLRSEAASLDLPVWIFAPACAVVMACVSFFPLLIVAAAINEWVIDLPFITTRVP